MLNRLQLGEYKLVIMGVTVVIFFAQITGQEKHGKKNQGGYSGSNYQLLSSTETGNAENYDTHLESYPRGQANYISDFFIFTLHDAKRLEN